MLIFGLERLLALKVIVCVHGNVVKVPMLSGVFGNVLVETEERVVDNEFGRSTMGEDVQVDIHSSYDLEVGILVVLIFYGV